MSNLKSGNKYFLEKKYKAAIDCYKKVIEENPSMAKAIEFNLKYCHIMIEKSNYLSIKAEGNNQNVEEGNAKEYFDPIFYLDKNPDVRRANLDPYTHFIRHGWKEGRNPSREFDINWYLKQYEECSRANVNPLIFHAKQGRSKGYKTRSRALNKNNTNLTPGFLAVDRGVFAEGVAINKFSSCFQDFISLNAKPHDVINQELWGNLNKSANSLNYTVSVIIPSWNRKAVVCNAIDSVLSQSYKNYEIILVDDGSDDGTCEFIEEKYRLAISSGVLKVIREKHLGVCNARNVGLELSKGDLIAYLDSDNIWRPDYLLLIAALFSDNTAINTAYCALMHNDLDKNTKKSIGLSYDRHHLLFGNYIDLNCFAHRRFLYDLYGGFDKNLKRLVDWDLIIRYTQLNPPVYIPYCAVDYFLDEVNLSNISKVEPFTVNKDYVTNKHKLERFRYGIDDCKIAYVLWDWPALSQTFVVEEIRWLIENDQDVIVYYKIEPSKSFELDFDVEAHKVNDSSHLTDLMKEHQRNICHSHFAYPAAAQLAYPACIKLGIYFTIFAHAVDIFHENNRKRNLIAEMSASKWCLKIFVHGDYHRSVLEADGVDSRKIFYALQATKVANFENLKPLRPIFSAGKQKGVFIGRFVEKKGLEILIRAAELLSDHPVLFDIYGYGETEDGLRKLVKEKNIKNVSFKGSIDGPMNVAKVIEDSDFLVVPSVVAKNGDTEGFPTVIFEAMAARRPVVTSSVSAIPDYIHNKVQAILVNPGDSVSLSDGVKELLYMSENRREAMLNQASKLIVDYVDVEQTMRAYFSVWKAVPINIVLVTFNNEKYDDRVDTFEVIRRIVSHTNNPYELTIVDNGSSSDFKFELNSILKGNNSVRLIYLKENIYCGPASNIGLALGTSKYAVYVCSKEGFVLKHGWDKWLVNHMIANPDESIAGYLTHMPKYTLGRDLISHPDFNRYRNQGFARSQPDREFVHVQGGVFIIERSLIQKVGGFSDLIPQGGMDIEYSYYLDSLGYKLGEVKQLASITVKTLPKIESVLNENISIAHPLSKQLAPERVFNKIPSQYACTCNVCGSLDCITLDDEVCIECVSTGFHRRVYNYLAHSCMAHRSLELLVLTPLSKGFNAALGKRMFRISSNSHQSFFDKNLNDEVLINDLIVYDEDILDSLQLPIDRLEVLLRLYKQLKLNGSILFSPSSQNSFSLKCFSEFLELNGLMESTNFISSEISLPHSYFFRHDWRPLFKIKKLT